MRKSSFGGSRSPMASSGFEDAPTAPARCCANDLFPSKSGAFAGSTSVRSMWSVLLHSSNRSRAASAKLRAGAEALCINLRQLAWSFSHW